LTTQRKFLADIAMDREARYTETVKKEMNLKASTPNFWLVNWTHC
jgi:hypothetical protein